MAQRPADLATRERAREMPIYKRYFDLISVPIFLSAVTGALHSAAQHQALDHWRYAFSP